MQLVHWNTAFENYEVAKTKQSGLAVLAILFDGNKKAMRYKPLSVSLFLSLKHKLTSTLLSGMFCEALMD